MKNIITVPKKEYRELKIKYPKVNKKEYRAAWRNFEKLLKKVSRLWKTKKSGFEILREERE
ncbi:MAG: hypothetical protein CO077_01460 [Candidatus Nealsonbacteria bacterium CG_4_9_14_0_8_um_filter_35_12]|uniref:Uncharacterized protein n=1 Tax=Candidatus Nealsonbacteria bacterium CG_4_9_14_0_8_um_filter_35_12 TaxID=1974692 RepID=A0A2M8DMX2_9BACT|nr:MAG: hypothetical protein CO077_01460 [Candidatus Nealsonbacteria bacterium CG_4_9_14_0_8_um_filter_35_12]